MVINTISQAFQKAPNWNGYENLALCRPKKLYINHGDLISREASETRILWIFIVTGAVLALGSIHLSFWNFFIFQLFLVTNVVGMSIEKLFDMWRNYEFSNFHETYFLKYKTETAKTVQRQLHILHNISKIRNFVTYQITFLLKCQPQNRNNYK